MAFIRRDFARRSRLPYVWIFLSFARAGKLTVASFMHNTIAPLTLIALVGKSPGEHRSNAVLGGAHGEHTYQRNSEHTEQKMGNLKILGTNSWPKCLKTCCRRSAYRLPARLVFGSRTVRPDGSEDSFPYSTRTRSIHNGTFVFNDHLGLSIGREMELEWVQMSAR